MILALPNPKKTLQINKNVEDVRQAIEHLPLFTDKYSLIKNNPIINQFTFSASEFLSIGVYIEVNYNSVEENKTEITIEVIRKVGSFNQSHEITNANHHLIKIVELITQSLETEIGARLDLTIQKEKEIKEKEDTLTKIREENKEKARLQKEKNPFAYYTKQTLFLLLTLAIVVCLFYGFYVFLRWLF